jgi:hypothetical protein
MEVYMITRISKKVICIKDIPSNLIEEAIFILKTNDKNDASDKPSQKKRGSDLILREAEEIVNEYVGKFQKEFESERRVTERKKYNIERLKMNALGLSLIFVGVCILISLVIGKITNGF